MIVIAGESNLRDEEQRYESVMADTHAKRKLFQPIKLGGMKRGDPELSFTLRGKQGRDAFHVGFESDESSTPKKIKRTHMFNRLMDGLTLSSDGGERYSSSGDEATNISPSTPPIFNRRNSRRRKDKI
ncbi:PLATZ transcription factor family protein isoform 5 [Tripterygium wilfordii]|uniref:PLATZ transcription factor family protein isoform 5 n=1 Tax=Tripterygium wilfordii TaxID=458696 RepID=A0A7J7DLQ5_TRIWF|nr:PLATZ transcription factor family protein isoform 5 [Tripterygium wilfordii]